MCLSNIRGWRFKKALFLYGPGDTGKSILKSLVENLLGKGNFIGVDLDEIEARFGTGSIYGKRLAGSSDMSFLTVAELKTFKKCTGGDSLFAEFKGQNSFEYTLSGTKESRPEFQRMLNDCRSGKIDKILCKSISRFARNTIVLLETVRELKGLGVSVYFEEQNIDTMSGDGELDSIPKNGQ